jgi:hypothetical protein
MVVSAPILFKKTIIRRRLGLDQKQFQLSVQVSEFRIPFSRLTPETNIDECLIYGKLYNHLSPNTITGTKPPLPQ